MREIKFRGKRVDNGEWVYGKDLMQHNKNSQVWIKDFDTSESDWKSVIPETVGQYTGLTDKNGKEIYEGDVVHLTEDGDFEVGHVPLEIKEGIIKFFEGSFCIYDEKNCSWKIIDCQAHLINMELEVISTIFDKDNVLEED